MAFLMFLFSLYPTFCHSLASLCVCWSLSFSLVLNFVIISSHVDNQVELEPSKCRVLSIL